MLSGCMEHARVARSLKDDAPRPAHAVIDRTRAEAPKVDFNVIDRAKAEQAARCGQRHIEYGNGTLSESEEQKRLADSICVELHKYDYVR
jgi:beta-glucanase (GH16 family)